MRRAIAAVIVLGTCAAGTAADYTPPAKSAAAVAGVRFETGTPVGEQFAERVRQCDVADACRGKPMRCSNDKSRNTALIALDGGVLFFDAKMAVDADGSPLSKKNAGPTDQPETSFRYPIPGQPSVDADKVPFIVIPLGGFAETLGVAMGDVAAVVHDDEVVFALVADQGPACKLGEGSIQLHQLLGHLVCKQRNAAGECEKLRDVSIESDVLYFVFPNSHDRIVPGLTPANVNERVQTVGAELFGALRHQTP